MARFVLVALLCLSSAVPATGETVAFTGAHLIPVTGDEIPDGTLVVVDGWIKAVGTADQVSYPGSTTVIDMNGKVIMPGLVDTHSHIGGFRRVVAAAGVPCSIITVDSPGGKLEAVELRFETGAVMAAVTSDAARLLGVDDRVGSLTVGKDGDLALYDGDPFEYTSYCVGVVIEGEVVSETVR